MGMGIRRLRAIRHTATGAVVAAYLLAAAMAIAAHKPTDGIALVVALATGAVLASRHHWNCQLIASTVLAAALVAVTASGWRRPGTGGTRCSIQVTLLSQRRYGAGPPSCAPRSRPSAWRCSVSDSDCNMTNRTPCGFTGCRS
jgi:hypothetical protein